MTPCMEPNRRGQFRIVCRMSPDLGAHMDRIRTYLPIGAVKVRHGHAPVWGVDRELHAFVADFHWPSPSASDGSGSSGWKVDSRLSEHLSMGFA
jgi:hypothetical protein